MMGCGAAMRHDQFCVAHRLVRATQIRLSRSHATQMAMDFASRSAGFGGDRPSFVRRKWAIHKGLTASVLMFRDVIDGQFQHEGLA
jgi:hypothetical protein